MKNIDQSSQIVEKISFQFGDLVRLLDEAGQQFVLFVDQEDRNRNFFAQAVSQNPLDLVQHLRGLELGQVSGELLDRVLDGLLDESAGGKDLDAQELQVAVVDTNVVHVERNQLVFKPVSKQMKIISTQIWGLSF